MLLALPVSSVGVGDQEAIAQLGLHAAGGAVADRSDAEAAI